MQRWPRNATCLHINWQFRVKSRITRQLALDSLRNFLRFA